MGLSSLDRTCAAAASALTRFGFRCRSPPLAFFARDWPVVFALVVLATAAFAPVLAAGFLPVFFRDLVFLVALMIHLPL